MGNEGEKDWIGSTEAARMLGITVRKLNYLCYEKRVPHRVRREPLSMRGKFEFERSEIERLSAAGGVQFEIVGGAACA